MKETQARDKDLQNTLNRLEAERDLAYGLSRASTLDQIAELVLAFLKREKNIPVAGIYYHNDHTRELVLLDAYGLSQEYLEQVRTIASPDPRYQLVSQGEIIKGARGDWSEPIQLSLGNEGVEFVMMLPLLSHSQKILGCINIGLAEKRELPPEDVLEIERFCFQIAEVVERIQAVHIRQNLLFLGESERRFRTLIENSSDIICIRNAQMEIQYISPSVERILGYSPQKMVAKQEICPLYPEDEARFELVWQALLEKPGEPFQEIIRVLDRRGSIHFMDMIAVNMLEHPDINGVVSNSRDITGELETHRLLEGSEQRFRAIFEKSKLGIALCTMDREIIEVNISFAQMLQYSREELLGKSIDVFSLPEDDLLNERHLKEMRENKAESFSMEKRYIKKDGSILYTLLSVTVIDGEKSGEKLLVGIIDDITGKKKEEREIKKRLAYEEALSKCSEELLKKIPSDKVIQNVLSHLLHVSGMDRIYLYKNMEDPELGLCMSLVERVAYSKPSLGKEEWSELTKIPFQNFDIMLSHLPENKVVNEILVNLPAHKQELWKKHGIQSALVVPVFVSEVWYGFLLFHDLKKEEKRTEEEIWFIKRAVDMLGAYLERENMLKKLHASKKNLSDQVAARTRTLQDLNQKLILENEEKALLAKELRKKEESYRVLFASSPVANFVVSGGGDILEFNSEACRLLDVTPRDLKGKNLQEWIMLDKGKKYLYPNGLPYERALRSNIILRGEEAGIMTFDYQLRWVDVGAAPLGEGKVLLTFTDITRRRQVEERMSNLMQKDRVLMGDLFFLNYWLAHLSQAIDPVDNIAEVLDFITQFESIEGVALLRPVREEGEDAYHLDYSLAFGEKKKVFSDVISFSHLELERVKEVFQPSFVYQTQELQKLNLKGWGIPDLRALMLYPLENEGIFYGYLIFARSKKSYFGLVARKVMQILSNTFSILLKKHEDLEKINKLEREQKLQEKMILRSERLASLGSLVSAIGHEINQPLQSIKVIADSMLYWAGEKGKEPAYENLLESFKKISLRVGRADEIVKNMRLILQSPERTSIEQISIQEMVEKVTGIFRQKIKNHAVTLDLDLAPGLSPVLMAAVHFQQVLVNLLNNALAALKDYSVDQKIIRMKSYEDQNSCFFVVEDNGPGIPLENKEKIFNPFFSTYMSPDSMGMGLYVASNILRSLGASIEVMDSELGGAKFVICFPKSY